MVAYEVEAQGRLLKVSVIDLPTQKNKATRPKRGRVQGFSRKSRKRMLDMIARLELGGSCHFITLTYSDHCIPEDWQVSKAHLHAFTERVKRAWKGSSILWRVEPKRRKSGEYLGAIVPHYHLIVWNAPGIGAIKTPFRETTWAAWAWDEIIKHTVKHPAIEYYKVLQVDVKLLETNRAITSYVAKYTAKMEDAESSLDSVPYLHGGRCWGIINKAHLPFAECLKMIVRNGLEGLYTLRRAAIRYLNQKRARSRVQGFSVYTSHIDRWLDFVYWCILSGAEDHASRVDSWKRQRQQSKFYGGLTP